MRREAPDGAWLYYIEEAQSLALDILEAETKVKQGRRIKALKQNPDFAQLTAELERDVVQRVLKTLMRKELSPYQLGHQQGFLKGITILANTEEMDDAEILRLESEVLPQLREKMATVTRLLESVPQQRT